MTHALPYSMAPRQVGIVPGGTFELDVESTTPDAATDQQIIGAHKAVFDSMR